MKAAVADSVESRPTDVESSSGDADSVRAPPLTVSSTSDSTEENRPVEGTEEPPRSLCTLTSTRGEVSTPHADLQDCPASANNSCSYASAVEGSVKVENLAEDELGSEAATDDQKSITEDEDETKGVEPSMHTTDDYRCRNETSSCNELSSSLTDSLDICEQGMIGCDGDGLVSAEESEVGTVAVSTAPTSECTSASCQCGSGTSSVVVSSCHGAGSPEFESENAAGCLCSCDVDESLSELETVELLSESSQPHNSSASDSEPGLTVSAASKASGLTFGDEADVIPISSLDVHDLHASTSSLPASDVCQVTSGVEMETELEAVGSGLPLTDATGTSLVPEPDCEPGSKASKLDRPLVADSLTGGDSEASDTGALHMSVGFQSAPDDHRAATSDDDAEVSRDACIGVLMVCDDDGLVSSVDAAPSVIVTESTDDDFVASPDDGDYESLVDDTRRSSDETAAGKRPSEVSDVRVDEDLPERSDAVMVKNVMLYEVDSGSREMNDLLADVSTNGVDTSHEARLSDTSVLSHDDSEWCRHLF